MKLPALRFAVSGVVPSLATAPGPITLALSNALPVRSKPNLLERNASAANSVGTASGDLSDIVSSLLNSVILTPCLKPSPSKLLIAIDAAKVTVPVPWSTLKNFPTLKNPSWSVDAKNTLPFPLSLTSFDCVAD